MVPHQPWFERRFSFDLPVSAAPGLIERLRGTPARLEHRLRGISPLRLTARHEDRWSIQENVGHLWDLEPLWLARVEDLAAGRPTLRAADLQNRRTHEANHNGRPLADLLAGFAGARAALVGRLEAAEEADWVRSAKHPRLRTNMRLLDLTFFVAEHDDHHLATITGRLRPPPVRLPRHERPHDLTVRPSARLTT
jgi:uncharacterized damage-inducible protein DinB